MNIERTGSILCFGEVLLRLSTSPGTRLSNATGLSLHVGGAEANVAAVLAQLGHQVEMVTALPTSSLGDLCEAELRRIGLGMGKSIRADGRLGLYFFERIADGGRIIYDRDDSAFERAADRFDWAAFAEDARWFHVSGITLALGKNAGRSALNAVEAMRSAGATVSFDVNHRSLLWNTRPPGDFERVRGVARIADVLFASPEDLSRILELDLPCDGPQDRRSAAEAAFAAFPRLQFVASTRRTYTEDRQGLSARIDGREGGHETKVAKLYTIIDRIGSGDAFAGAVIDCILSGASAETCSRRALAAAVLKHGIAGDHWIGTREELDAFDPYAPRDIRR